MGTPLMRTPERGFTLLEVLVAMALIAFGVLAVAPMFIYAAQSNAVGSDYGHLGALAVDRMERLRELDFKDPLLAAGGSLTDNVTNGVDYFDASNPEGIIRWKVDDALAFAGTKTVTVRAVARRAVVGLPKEVIVATVRGE